MLCANAAFFGTKNDKNPKSNPWGLQEKRWAIWTCCVCFRRRHVVPAELSTTSTPILSMKIPAEKDEETQTKVEDSQNSPSIRRSSAQVFSQLPPPSSGSESSGYFTPPAEHHLKVNLDRFVRSDNFEENNNFSRPEPNFQVVDSESSECQEFEVIASPDELSQRLDAESFEDPNENYNEQAKRYSPRDEVDFAGNPRSFTASKSKSEANLKRTLPEIAERKNINSAPLLNDAAGLVPYSFAETKITSIAISLPGSVASSDIAPPKKPSPRRLLKRSISIRAPPSTGRSSKSPKTPDSKSLIRPKELLNQCLAQMESSEWEITIQGLNALIRLSHTNADILETQMHAICVTLAKDIKNLRSQVARTACHAASEIFSSCKKALEVELEELAVPLLHRTADTNKFLRSDANSALDAMSLNMPVSRVVAVISGKGSTHQNCVVRAAAARLLCDIAMRMGPERVFQLPKDTRDKFLIVAANGLTEGSLDSRKYAKALMSTLAGHHQFQKALLEAVPQHTLRHIAKIISSLK